MNTINLTPMHTTALAVVAGAATLYVSMKPLMEAVTKLQMSPSDDEIGQIYDENISYEDLIGLGKYKGKKALLVGGTRGVGLGTAIAMAKAGADVTVVGRSDKSGAAAVQRIKYQGESKSVSYIRGDIGTVSSTKALVDRIVKSGAKYDYFAVTAAIFPNPTQTEPNEDGLEKAFAIGVVGRFLLYRNMHKFLNDDARVLNVLASGCNLYHTFDPNLTRQAKGLFPTIGNFAVGCEMMIAKLQEKDANIKKFTMVSTHPGSLKTDLHRGQGLWFDAIETVACHFMGISEETAGLRQASIVSNHRLHEGSLSYVDNFGHGRLMNEGINKNIEEHGDWLWDMLCELEESTEKQ